MNPDQRFLILDSLPKEFLKVVAQKNQKTCIFCSSMDNDYYYEIVREWYDVCKKTRYPRELKPEKCPHDEWLVEKSGKLVQLLKDAVRKNDDNFTCKGITFADVDACIPKDVLSLLADPDTMEFIILEKVEFQRSSLKNIVMQESRANGISITFEQYQEIYEIVQRKLQSLSKGDTNSMDVLKELCDFVKVLDPSIDMQEIHKVLSVLEKFEERTLQDQLCKETIEMLREIQEFITSLDAEKYNSNVENHLLFISYNPRRPNLRLAKKEKDEFYKWLKETEKKIGRKASIVDIVAIKSEIDFESL